MRHIIQSGIENFLKTKDGQTTESEYDNEVLLVRQKDEHLEQSQKDNMQILTLKQIVDEKTQQIEGLVLKLQTVERALCEEANKSKQQADTLTQCELQKEEL